MHFHRSQITSITNKRNIFQKVKRRIFCDMMKEIVESSRKKLSDMFYRKNVFKFILT